MGNAEALRVADVARHVARCRDRVDARKLAAERRETQALDALGVHVSEVVIADLLRVGSGSAVRLLRCCDDQVSDFFLRLVIENDE